MLSLLSMANGENLLFSLVFAVCPVAEKNPHLIQIPSMADFG